ncbi:sodium:proton antiporter [Nannocystis sp. ILAH1]|uniref:sodium:proton antiporter n=1 Tax=Nannocystis sp. ILAH1 TaxID=2996789 RepID=UPI00226DE09E|nr:sodium:proton antiporter [Nannocystis sp. ILAH1]MCY0993118.1 sodium:proton antiporter [Nannocystis sp. ILAH1]
MRRVVLFSVLLTTGLVLSQVFPALTARDSALSLAVKLFTMTALAFIMIHVGREFEVDKSRLRAYGWDYVVAMTAATFPWLLVSGYFLLFLLPTGAFGSLAAWREALLAGRFAAPTSAGLLFTMLAAAGLGASWVYRKVRVLAIFDDLDTVVLMIPLKMLMVGLAWQMGATLAIMVLQLWIAWRWLHSLSLPSTWPWIVAYSAALTAACEGIYFASTLIDDTVPIYMEVLLPAFVLGCVMTDDGVASEPREQSVANVVSACFMLLVGLSMPAIVGRTLALEPTGRVSAELEIPSWGLLGLHTLAVTALSNVGKLFPWACYRREASFRERTALAVAMWPRGEVGAGVLVLGISYGLGGPMVAVASLSLALNLLLTGPYILLVKRLIPSGPTVATDCQSPARRAGRG